MKDVLEYALCQKHFACQGTRFVLLFRVKLACVPRRGLCSNTQLVNVCAVSDYRVIGIARLYAEFGEDPDPIGKFERLIQHVLAFDVPLGDGVDVVVLQFAWHRICQYNRHMVTQQDIHRSLTRLQLSDENLQFILFKTQWSNKHLLR